MIEAEAIIPQQITLAKFIGALFKANLANTKRWIREYCDSSAKAFGRGNWHLCLKSPAKKVGIQGFAYGICARITFNIRGMGPEHKPLLEEGRLLLHQIVSLAADYGIEIKVTEIDVIIVPRKF